MKFKTGDKVIAIAGKDKGRTGRISKVLSKTNKVVVEGINLVKKHIKPNANDQTGGIVSVEAPIDASNVMFFNEKTNKRSRKRVTTETKEVKKTAPKKAKAKKD
ncbi:MAG: 50S ribosomal protein L24 [Bacilli bacterium]|nr:50S ribosomal protein L24 [Bacilli bacterium]MDD4643553.1 50S ribosomal protein L24 [Bacilli bacterium]